MVCEITLIRLGPRHSAWNCPVGPVRAPPDRANVRPMSYRMVLPTLALAFAATACGPTFEGACKSFCDKAAECTTEMVSDADLAACKAECVSAEAQAQSNIEAGTLTQECYDATTDLIDCGNGLSCTELESDTVPADCAEQNALYETYCPTST